MKTRKYQENLSGWNQALKDCGLSNTVKDDRLGDLKRLIASGLPTYKYHEFNCEEFYTSESISKITDEYIDGIIVRAIPKINKQKNGFQRFTIIEKDLENIINTLKQKIPEMYEKDYTIVINEYDPAQYCGVVISKPGGSIIEIVEDVNLERLCHSNINPWSAQFKQELPYQFKRMRYLNVENSEVKDKMWNVIKTLSTQNKSNFTKEETESTIPYFEPLLGYFEFVFSKRNKGLYFIDYKVDY